MQPLDPAIPHLRYQRKERQGAGFSGNYLEVRLGLEATHDACLVGLILIDWNQIFPTPLI
jgi:ribosomal protein L13E